MKFYSFDELTYPRGGGGRPCLQRSKSDPFWSEPIKLDSEVE